MIASGPKDIVFSRSSEDIVVTDIPDKLPFSVKIHCEGQTFGFTARAYNGSYRLRLSELLQGLEENTIIPDVPAGGFLLLNPRSLKIDFCISDRVETSVNVNWLPGYCDATQGDISQLLQGSYWWSFRPQSALTYKQSKEVLQCAIPADFPSNQDILINVDIHFAKAEKKKLVYQKIRPTSGTRLLIVDCSYRHIESLALKSGYTEDHILAYDVSGEVNGKGDLPIGQRFIIAPNNRDVRGWLFRNSLGGFDTVYSSGPVQRSLDSEAKTFVISRKELELQNITRETFSIDTGYISNSTQLNLWYEFFRSAERYIILPQGEAVRIVVDESDSKKTLNEAGSLTFKCRMAEDIQGYDFEKTHLEEFSKGFT